jgi:NAD-dependent SIR2 family protein deacetylase
MSMSPIDSAVADAARLIQRADALLFMAGAGMGVDSGVPDFRGIEGFWRAYPPYAALGLHFEELANPATFARDPHLAWGFYGHRLNLYRRTEPHAGFGLLLRWGRATPRGYFVFTSNVDAQFQRAGFDPQRVVECHGSLMHLQCTQPCGEDVWRADGEAVSVDEATMRAVDPLPTCPRCGALARPNVLMFGDWSWVDDRTGAQLTRYGEWFRGVRGRQVVIIECGAGSAVATIRHHSERTADQLGATLVRVNPREPDVPAGHVPLPLGSRDALESIDRLMPRATSLEDAV